MSVAIVDTSIIIHLFRKNKAAHAWFAALTDTHAVTTITWLEVMYGAPGKLGQKDCKAILEKFDLIRLNDADQDWAMAQMMLYRLSKGIAINDCLIASVAHRLEIPVLTHNIKDLLKLLPAHQVVVPYTS